MRTNIDIDDNLIKTAMEMTHIDTKKKVVEYALQELVSKYKRKSILKYQGKMKWEGNLDEMREDRDFPITTEVSSLNLI